MSDELNFSTLYCGAGQLLFGHIKLESTYRYQGIEVGDAVEMAEQRQCTASELLRQSAPRSSHTLPSRLSVMRNSGLLWIRWPKPSG